MSIEAMKQALEALEKSDGVMTHFRDRIDNSEAITALRTAIEQAEKQEPVANLTVEQGRVALAAVILPDGVYDLYTTPPAAQRQWVGLTDDDVRSIYERPELKGSYFPALRKITRAIEAKLREKNGGQA